MTRRRVPALVTALAVVMVAWLSFGSRTVDLGRDDVSAPSVGASSEWPAPVAVVRTDGAAGDSWLHRSTKVPLLLVPLSGAGACGAVLLLSWVRHRAADGAPRARALRHSIVLRAPPSFVLA